MNNIGKKLITNVNKILNLMDVENAIKISLYILKAKQLNTLKCLCIKCFIFI